MNARAIGRSRFFRLLACAGLLFVAGCSADVPTCTAGSAGCTRVLFLGNSYTYVNDLPSTFARLANSGGKQVGVDMVANGGETLAEHANSPDSRARIAQGGWAYVVLQEQSDTPATAGGSQYSMFPAVRTLAGKIRDAGAQPLLFMTWAHRDGEPGTAMTTYESMQQPIDDAYWGIGRELNAPVAPVGFTWLKTRREHPDIALWGDDGSHPSTAGTYLAACVFYAKVFRQSPVGLSFYDGLPADQARTLQAEADANTPKD